MATQPIPFHTPWRDVPITMVDFETTGLRPGIDKAVQVGLARYEKGHLVGTASSLLNPGIAIPAEASEINRITDAMVIDAPIASEWFMLKGVQELFKGAQPAAYNAGFDRQFIPPQALADYSWPWLDSLTLVNVVDRFAKGAGRHKLTTTCARHGVELTEAHSALADAIAAAQLFFKLAPGVFDALEIVTIGQALHWTRIQEASRWANFHDWLARQPPQQVAAQ